MANKKKKGFRRRSGPHQAPKRRGAFKKRKQWTNEQMEAAMAAATKGTLSANKAADLHGVPRSTLKDRLSGRVAHGVKSGPRPYLTAEEEAELSSHLLLASDIGLGKTRRDVLTLVGTYVEKKGCLRGKGSVISNGWWDSFLKRNPMLSLRSGDSTATVRMDAMSSENMKAYFDLLSGVYDEFDFGNHPESIYNMDETGVPLEPRPPKVVARRGQKKVRCRTSGQKSQITVIGCGSASGQILPPFIIFAAKQLNHSWTKNEVSGSRYGVSDKGWVDQGLFHHWLKVHFLVNAVSRRPLLLLLDGHSSHFEPQSIEFAKENGVVIFCLPPHTTHECQPLDVGLFGPLKKHWQQERHRFYQSHPTCVLTKATFNSVFRQAWYKSVMPANITGGFRKAGVFPFDRNAVKVIDYNVDHTGECDQDDNGGGENNPGNEDPLGDDLSGSSLENGVDTVKVSKGNRAGSHGDSCSPFEDQSGHTGSGDHRGNGDSNPGNADVNNPLEEDTTGGGNVCDNVLFEGEATTSPGMDNTAGSLTFSVEEEMRYSIRFEEGYDLYDEKYESWLKINHPDVVSKTSTAFSSQISDTRQTPMSSTLSPTVSHESSSTQSVSQSSSLQTPMSSNGVPSTPTVAGASSSHQDQSAPGSTPLTTAAKRRSPLSDLLNLPNIHNAGSKTPSTGRARVLTSAECLRLLKEKEEKKKQLQEEKERRKVERELKKKQREEDKAKKAAEREAAKAKKEAARAEKGAAKTKTATSRATSGTKRHCPTNQRQAQKKARCEIDETVHENLCCVCFGSYDEDIGTGREWVECSCKRWLHEDCVDEEDMDSNGKLCPLC